MTSISYTSEIVNSCNPSLCISRKLNVVNRIVSNVFRKHLKQLNTTESQLSILFVISKKEVNQKMLGDFLYMEKSTVNRNLKRLLEGKLIKKQSSNLYILSKKGENLLELLIPKWEEAMTEARNILGKEGEAALNLILNKLK